MKLCLCASFLKFKVAITNFLPLKHPWAQRSGEDQFFSVAVRVMCVGSSKAGSWGMMWSFIFEIWTGVLNTLDTSELVKSGEEFLPAKNCSVNSEEKKECTKPAFEERHATLFRFVTW